MKYDAIVFLEELFQPPREGVAEPLPSDLTAADLPADWLFEWDERAAIMEEGCKIPKDWAEAIALADIRRRVQAAGTSLHNDT